MTNKKKLLSLLFLISCIYCNSVFATLIFSAPPRETPEQGKQIYGPIAEQLSKITGEKIEYVHPNNWTEYTRAMRDDKYDVIFDGSHFAAWRIKHLQNTAVAKLSGTLGFVIIAKTDEAKKFQLKDLIGKSLCGIASPNLGTMVAFSLFNNPVIQPEIKIIKGSVLDVYKAFASGQCHYAVLLDRFYNNLPPEKKKNIAIIAKSDQLPNQTFTVSKRVSEAAKKKIEKYMVTTDAALAGQKLLSIYSKKFPFFVQANPQEYEGLETLLEGVVFGW